MLQWWKGMRKVSRPLRMALQHMLQIIAVDHRPDPFAHLLQRLVTRVVVFAFGDVAGDPVGAYEVVPIVQATGAEGEVAHVDFYVSRGATTGFQANLLAPRRPVTGAAFVKGPADGVQVL